MPYIGIMIIVVFGAVIWAQPLRASAQTPRFVVVANGYSPGAASPTMFAFALIIDRVAKSVRTCRVQFAEEQFISTNTRCSAHDSK
jgi:hypothetical protein